MTAGYLHTEEWAHLAASVPAGATMRFNHDGCGDRRRRLYVTRKDGSDAGTCLAYCHNCGLGGRFVSGHRDRRTVVSGVPKSVVPDKFTLPPDTTFDYSEFGRHAIEWLRRYDLADPLPHPWVGYDRRHNAVVLPLWSKESGLEGYQTRSFDPEWKGPKYLTRKRPGAMLPQPLSLSPAGPSSQLVITEDSLSSIKVALAGHAGAPLWSAPHNSPNLVDLVKNYGQVTVWFDNDNAQVRANAVRLARRLRSFHPDVKIVLDKEDPKCYNIDTLREVLKND